MPIERDDVVHAVVGALRERGMAIPPKVVLLAATEGPGAVALRLGDVFAVGVAADPREGPPAFALAVSLDEAPLLSRLVVEAHASLQDPELVLADPDGFTTLAAVGLGFGQELRAVVVEDDASDEPCLALWRVVTAGLAEAVYTFDVVQWPLVRGHELGNMVRAGVAALGNATGPGSMALN
jgi:hypothetical protein